MVTQCSTVRSASAWTRLIPWVKCSHPICVIMSRHIGSGSAQWLPWEPLNIPRHILEMATKRNFTFIQTWRDILFLMLCISCNRKKNALLDGVMANGLKCFLRNDRQKKPNSLRDMEMQLIIASVLINVSLRQDFWWNLANYLLNLTSSFHHWIFQMCVNFYLYGFVR